MPPSVQSITRGLGPSVCLFESTGFLFDCKRFSHIFFARESRWKKDKLKCCGQVKGKRPGSVKTQCVQAFLPCSAVITAASPYGSAAKRNEQHVLQVFDPRLVRFGGLAVRTPPRTRSVGRPNEAAALEPASRTPNEAESGEIHCRAAGTLDLCPQTAVRPSNPGGSVG
jgi:hypothetical protein